MVKLIGTLRISPNAGSDAAPPHFEIVFVPYHGRIAALTVRIHSHEELVAFLMDLRIGEDEAAKWAGKARAQGVVLVPGIERTEAQLRESGLLA